MSSKSKNSKFNPLGSSIKRKADNRDEHPVAEEKPLMLFSFKDYQHDFQIPPGQTFEEWMNWVDREENIKEKNLILPMLEKLRFICQKNIKEVEQEGYIKAYRDNIDKDGFPLKSKFKNPFPNVRLNWAVIMRIGGQKPRIAGHIIGNIFYIVFLDAGHKFYPSDKKNT